jgi:two-component system chemotaxis response regulator CheY
MEMEEPLYQENCIAQNNYLGVGNIEMAVALWKESYIKYPSDYRVLKEYMNAMCLCRNRQYTDKIIDSALCIFRNCKDDVIVQSTEFILKAYLYNEYDLGHARKLKDEQHKEPLNQYQTNEIFNKCRVHKNEVIEANEELKILIADDAAFIRKVLKDLLQKERECVVSEACNGYEAIKAVEQSKPNLVVLDINMPEMDGIQALKQIRKMCPLIKIVMCSAMSYESTIKETAELGADGFIVKPFSQETFLKAVVER